MLERSSFFIGRFQPLHDGHKTIIQTALDEGKPVLIGLMDTEIDDANPYTMEQRRAMFREAFGDRVRVMRLPPIGEVCYGRNVGYGIRKIEAPREIEAINATTIRVRGDYQPPEPLRFDDPDWVSETWRVAHRVHALAYEQGFWGDRAERHIAIPIALCMSELAEALEYARIDPRGPDKNIQDMTGLEVQLSDALGILLDMMIGYGLNLPAALLKKMEYNRTRGWMHGGKNF